MLNLEKLAKIRKKRKYSQLELAEELGLSQQQYSRYEIGKYPMPLETFTKVCEKLDISADYLLDLSNKDEGSK